MDSWGENLHYTKDEGACTNALPAAKRHIMIAITVNSYLYFARGADMIQERRLKMTKKELKYLIQRIKENKYLTRDETNYIIKALEQESCAVNIKDLSDDEIKKFKEIMKKATVQVIPKEPCEDKIIDEHYWKGFNNGIRTERFRESKRELCEDCISRQAALDAMFALCDTGETLKENPWRDNPHIDAITDAIDNLPTITPQPKMGRWVIKFHGFPPEPTTACSECGFDRDFYVRNRGLDKMKYCPNCGAKMESEASNEDNTSTR